MGNNVNLDAARAARSEAQGEHPTVTLGGQVFELPVELPFAVVEMVGELAGAAATTDDPNAGAEAATIIGRIARALFGTRYQDFIDLGPSLADINAVLEGIAPLYGLGLGESQASES